MGFADGGRAVATALAGGKIPAGRRQFRSRLYRSVERRRGRSAAPRDRARPARGLAQSRRAPAGNRAAQRPVASSARAQPRIASHLRRSHCDRRQRGARSAGGGQGARHCGASGRPAARARGRRALQAARLYFIPRDASPVAAVGVDADAHCAARRQRSADGGRNRRLARARPRLLGDRRLCADALPGPRPHARAAARRRAHARHVCGSRAGGGTAGAASARPCAGGDRDGAAICHRACGRAQLRAGHALHHADRAGSGGSGQSIAVDRRAAGRPRSRHADRLSCRAGGSLRLGAAQRSRAARRDGGDACCGARPAADAGCGQCHKRRGAAHALAPAQRRRRHDAAL